ncbi:hypothetical protein [Haloactinopolyspora alba]|nr:hypothetical protein [Haloactinopolyspora alba]
MSGNDESKVSNPAHERLVALRDRVTNNRWMIERTLKDAKTRMHDGETWTGSSAAEPWAEEVGGRHDKLPDLLDRVIDAIEDRMGQVPEEIESPPYGGTRPN